MDVYFNDIENLIDKNILIRPASLIIDKSVIIVQDYNEALDILSIWEDGYMIFNDLKSNEAAKIWKKIYESNENQKLREKIVEKSRPLFIKMSKYLSKTYPELSEELEHDFESYVLSNVFQVDTIYIKFFEYYKQGVWPCGWKGQYPQGKMIVYCPKVS